MQGQCWFDPLCRRGRHARPCRMPSLHQGEQHKVGRFWQVLISIMNSKVHDVSMQEWFFWNPNCSSSGIPLP